MAIFKQDGRIEDLSNALFFTQFMRLNSGHIEIEAEEKEGIFGWTAGATVFYSPAKEFLLNVGISDRLLGMYKGGQ
ncbi:MAG TPA: hypothetical protein HA362_01130 [Nanoarchaeota archaeon]|nr:hypothetical protein [Nanoarchaeota archaeon]